MINNKNLQHIIIRMMMKMKDEREESKSSLLHGAGGAISDIKE